VTNFSTSLEQLKSNISTQNALPPGGRAREALGEDVSLRAERGNPAFSMIPDLIRNLHLDTHATKKRPNRVQYGMDLSLALDPA